MLDIMYEIPKDDNIGEVTITELILKEQADRSSVCGAGSTGIKWLIKTGTLQEKRIP